MRPIELLRRARGAFEERTGLIKLLSDLARHPVPPDTGWWYVFGSATLVAFIIQVVTGMALATAYIPATGDASQALFFISRHAFMGNLLRGMHYFGASAMVLLVGIHMGQVFLMGCYKYPREVNWITGVLLLFLTIAMGFTGQLLRWDQNAVWSVFVGAEQAGRAPFIGKAMAHFLLAGDTLGGATLSRFFAFHVFFIPAIIFAVVAIHLYLVLHDGISEPPVPGEKVDPKTYRARYEKLITERGQAFWPDVAWRDVVFAFAVVVAVVAAALIFGPPELGRAPNPSLINADPRLDWYLVWYFGLLALLPPRIETAFIVAAPLIVIVFLLVVPVLWNKGERHPRNRPWAVAAVIVIVLTIGSLWIARTKAPWSPNFEAEPLPEEVVASNDKQVQRGAQLFYDKACEFCHDIGGYGGHLGPILTDVANRMTTADITKRILNGGINMPAYASTLKPEELDALVAFLNTRKTQQTTLQR